MPGKTGGNDTFDAPFGQHGQQGIPHLQVTGTVHDSAVLAHADAIAAFQGIQWTDCIEMASEMAEVLLSQGQALRHGAMQPLRQPIEVILPRPKGVVRAASQQTLMLLQVMSFEGSQVLAHGAQ